MAARTWVVVMLLASLALAGCTKPTDDAPTGSPSVEPAPQDPPAAAPGASPGGSATVTPRPQDFQFSDGGSIQGSFDDAWDVELQSPIYRSAQVIFTLDGVQPGAPPTARVNLAFLDPQGAPLKTATLGVGGEGNVADWTFAPGELAQPGTYRLVATPGEQAPLPSLGLASYGVLITIDY